MQIVYKNVGDLVRYENNPRDNVAAIPYVAESIKEFGFKVPIVIDRNNVIIAGHTRLEAAITLNMEEVPCIVADDLTDEQVAALRLVDNKTHEFSKWDAEMLNIELESIMDIDMEKFGFLEIETPAIDLGDDDEEKEKKAKTVCCPKCGFEFET